MAYFDGLESKLTCGPGAGALVAGVPLTPPDGERASYGQQRRGVLDDDRQRRERAGCDDVESRQALGPALCARVHDDGVCRLRSGDGPREERAPPRRALDERNPRRRQRDCEHQPGNAGTRPQIGKVHGRADRRDLETDQRVREMVVDRLERVTDGGRRERILDEQAMERKETRDGVVRERIALRQSRDPRRGVASRPRLTRPLSQVDLSMRSRSRAMYPA